MPPVTDPADPAPLSEFIRTARHSLFRLETLDAYGVASDGSDFGRWLAGEPAPDPDRKGASHAILQARKDAGITMRRVHIVRSPLSDYLRYEMDWGYGPNSKYEDIRILDLAEREWPWGAPALPDEDAWVIDGRDIAVMSYDGDGRYCGFELAEGQQVDYWLDVMVAAWNMAEPYGAWWAAHPQFWRDQAALT